MDYDQVYLEAMSTQLFEKTTDIREKNIAMKRISWPVNAWIQSFPVEHFPEHGRILNFNNFVS